MLATQSRADCSAEFTLFAVLFGIPHDDHIRQALTMQPNLTLQQLSDTVVRVDAGLKLHLVDAESANAASGSNCWRWDAPGHLAPNCPHSGAIKDLVIRSTMLIARRCSTVAPKTRPPPRLRRLPPHLTPLLLGPAGVATSFLSTAGPITDDWLWPQAQ